MSSHRSTERRLERLHQDGEHTEAVRLLVESYGPELLGFLAAIVGHEDAARDVFGQVCESVVRDLDRFDGRSTYRTWAYAIARHAALNARRRRKPERLGTDRMAALVWQPRTSTRPYLETGNKTRLAELRAHLDPASQALLTLRIDRSMSWREIATVLSDTPIRDEAQHRRLAARTRKRFERLKERLREAMGGPRE